MLHTPIIADEAVDPDVVQAITDFRAIAERVRRLSARAAALPVGHKERLGHEQQINSDMAAFATRAERIGGDWTAASLLIAVQNNIDARARRVHQPQRTTKRVHEDRVQMAAARVQTAKLAFDSARLELDAAAADLEAAEKAATHAAARRGGGK